MGNFSHVERGISSRGRVLSFAALVVRLTRIVCVGVCVLCTSLTAVDIDLRRY